MDIQVSCPHCGGFKVQSYTIRNTYYVQATIPQTQFGKYARIIFNSLLILIFISLPLLAFLGTVGKVLSDRELYADCIKIGGSWCDSYAINLKIIGQAILFILLTLLGFYFLVLMIIKSLKAPYGARSIKKRVTDNSMIDCTCQLCGKKWKQNKNERHDVPINQELINLGNIRLKQEEHERGIARFYEEQRKKK